MENENPKQAFDSFFRREYKKMVNYVRKNMEERFNDASPEDIVQDVALSLLSKLDLNVQIDNLGGYIYRSIKNKIIDNQRKTRPDVSVDNFNDLNNNNLLDVLSDELLTEDSYLANIEPHMLYEAISSLNPEEQAIISAAEFEGKTFEMLSKEWSIPIGTLLSRKHRALSKLHKKLTNNSINNNN